MERMASSSVANALSLTQTRAATSAGFSERFGTPAETLLNEVCKVMASLLNCSLADTSFSFTEHRPCPARPRLGRRQRGSWWIDGRGASRGAGQKRPHPQVIRFIKRSKYILSPLALAYSTDMIILFLNQPPSEEAAELHAAAQHARGEERRRVSSDTSISFSIHSLTHPIITGPQCDRRSQAEQAAASSAPRAEPQPAARGQLHAV